MELKSLIKFIDGFYKKEVILEINSINIDIENWCKPHHKKSYNSYIKENIDKNEYGVYVWTNGLTGEILYIGMAGRVKKNGKIGDHSLADRLVASRGKDNITKKDIQTNEFILNYLNTSSLESMIFHVFYSKNDCPPTYIETVLLYNYFKHTKSIPLLNNAF